MKYPEKSNFREKWFVLVSADHTAGAEEAVGITPTVVRQKAMIAPAQLSFSTNTVPDPSPENGPLTVSRSPHLY